MDPELYRAASSGDLSFFERLANSETLVDVTIEKSTVLHVAVQCNHLQVAQKIVESRPSLLNQTNSKRNTPLHVAARVGSRSMVKLLVEHAKSLDVEAGGHNILSMGNLENDTALHIAVRYGKSKVVEELIKGDPELGTLINKVGESALFLAVDRKFYRIASQILSDAPECSFAGRDGMNVLHAIAIRSSRMIIAKAAAFDLHDAGTDFTTRDMLFSKGAGVRFLRIVFAPFNLFLPYRWSISLKEIVPSRAQLSSKIIPEDFVTEVMQKCPSAIVQGEDSGWTPLHIASFMGNVKLVKLFLENGTSSLAYVKNKEGLSAFHIAAQEGNALVMKEFISACPDIYELLDNTGRTALHVAAERGEQEAVNFFLERPDLMGLIDQQDKEGNTPMHLAAFRGHSKVLFLLAHRRHSKVLFLVAHPRDVDINATNMEGLTTMDKYVSSTNIGTNLKTYIKHRLKGSQKGLRQIVNMCTRHLDPQVGEKERVLKKIGIESTDGGAVNATAIEEKAQKGQTAKENKVKNAVSESKKEISDNSMSESERVKSAGETNLLVATIIATVTFTAAFTVPGGYESGGVNSGLAVLSKRAAFKAFMIADAFAFAFSTASILVYLYSANVRRVLSSSDRKRKTEMALALSIYSIIALLIAFMLGTYAVVPHSLGISIAIIICFGFCSGQKVFAR